VTPSAHWPLVPVLVPLVAGVALLALGGAALATRRALAGLATLVQLAAALVLLDRADDGLRLAYAVGDWAAPYGVFLLVDRLSAWMLVLTACVATAAWLAACGGDDRDSPRYHALVQFQLLGLNGAFLTADLFNLFVFFEILLIASYALLAGRSRGRLRATVHVVVLNLAGSAVFLVGIACVYGATGTLSLADLALRAPSVAREDAGLAQAGAFLLLVVFALKAAAAPLGFWLPRAYAEVPPATAALFSVLTKVGVYAMLRLYTLAFPCFDLGPCGPSGLVLPFGLATVTLGAVGALASTRLATLAGHLVLVSVGTLLVAVGTFREAGQAAAVYYAAHSTLAGAALYLVAGAIARARGDAGDRLDRPVTWRDRAPGLLGALYGASAIAIVGLPPLSGFVGKVALLEATATEAGRIWPVVLGGTLVAALVAARAGSTVFWRDRPGVLAAPGGDRAARGAALVLLGLVVALTVAAGPAIDYARATARQLVDRRGYVDAVFAVGSLSAPVERTAPPLPPVPALAAEHAP
jgi:multicomponent K+:H+ antiporter subunit D